MAAYSLDHITCTSISVKAVVRTMQVLLHMYLVVMLSRLYGKMMKCNGNENGLGM